MDQERIIRWKELERQEIERKIADYQVRLRSAKRSLALFHDALQDGEDSQHLLNALAQSNGVDWHGLLDVLEQIPKLYEARKRFQ